MTSHNSDSNSPYHPSTKKTKWDHGRFRQTSIRCYPETEYGSVYFSSFNPVLPILACGLNDGRILFIEGHRLNDSINQWSTRKTSDSSKKSAMSTLVWNMNGTVLLVGYLDGTISLWRQNDETTTDINDPDNEQVLAIACNRYSADVFAIRSLQTILLWNDAQSQPKVLGKRLNFHANIIRDMVWISRDQFVSCSDDGSILICQIGKDSALKSFFLETAVLSVSWNSQLNLLGSISTDGAVNIWSMEKSELVHTIQKERTKRPICMAWLPVQFNSKHKENCESIVCGLEDGSIFIWQMEKMADECPGYYLDKQHNNSIWDISFSPDGRFLASIDLQGVIIIYSTQDWKVSFRSQIPFRACKNSLMWGADGYKLAISNPTEEIHVIEAIEESSQ